MRKALILFITILMFGLTGCLSYDVSYKGQYKELYTTAIYSIPNAVGFMDHGEGTYDADIYIWEQDDYGRTLFAYCDDYSNQIFALVVSQCNDENNVYFYLPAKIVHIDGDDEYLEKCLKFYRNANVHAIGKKVSEDKIYEQVPILLKEYKPDILIITGHDAYLKKKGKREDLANYKNSINFVKAVKSARKYEKSHDKLVIIAGACQSNYEELIKAGANFASSPKRVNIHALDPAIIAVSLALTERNKEIDLIELLDKTKYGSDGMGGIMCNGLMYVGYPRE